MKRCKKCNLQVNDNVEVCDCGSSEFEVETSNQETVDQSVQQQAQVDEQVETNIFKRLFMQAKKISDVVKFCGKFILSVLAIIYFAFQTKYFYGNTGVYIVCLVGLIIACGICVHSAISAVTGIIKISKSEKQNNDNKNEKENV